MTPSPATNTLRADGIEVRRRISWRNVGFFAFAHVLAAATVAYLVCAGCSPWTLGLSALWMILCGLSITAGYHRHFAHPTHKAAWPLRAFYLLFGAASVQNSALKWSADHRLHHRCTDAERDPYNARRGFWWSHIGWIFFEDEAPIELATVADLQRDRLVRLQDRHLVLLALLAGCGVPAALGLLWGDPLGALLCAGFLRLVVQWHATFSINSLAHMLGTQPYSTACTARDSWVTAMITLGEGYHNYHHRFPGDYRNGVRWYHFDPTKWFLYVAEKLRLARDLRRVPHATIEAARATTLSGDRSSLNPGVPRGGGDRHDA
jgi:stearoyl-CoA desaturase (delta-9 desaturase)